MGIESDRVVCRGEEKRNSKELALGVEQEKLEGRVSIGLFVSLSLTISALYKIAVSLFGLLLQLCWWRLQVRSLGTCSPDYTYLKIMVLTFTAVNISLSVYLYYI